MIKPLISFTAMIIWEIQKRCRIGLEQNDASISGSLNISSTLADNNTIYGTQTLALESGSFAIDNGTGTGDDQRGHAVFNGTKDIGAYEYGTIYCGGTGTSGDPYLIGTIQDLIDLSNESSHWVNYFEQIADITFNADETQVDWDGDGTASWIQKTRKVPANRE